MGQEARNVRRKRTPAKTIRVARYNKYKGQRRY